MHILTHILRVCLKALFLCVCRSEWFGEVHTGQHSVQVQSQPEVLYAQLRREHLQNSQIALSQPRWVHNTCAHTYLTFTNRWMSIFDIDKYGHLSHILLSYHFPYTSCLMSRNSSLGCDFFGKKIFSSFERCCISVIRWVPNRVIKQCTSSLCS